MGGCGVDGRELAGLGDLWDLGQSGRGSNIGMVARLGRLGRSFVGIAEFEFDFSHQAIWSIVHLCDFYLNSEFCMKAVKSLLFYPFSRSNLPTQLASSLSGPEARQSKKKRK